MDQCTWGATVDDYEREECPQDQFVKLMALLLGELRGEPYVGCYAIMERDGLGNHIAEVGPFLSPSGQLGHGIICRMDIILHCSSISINIVHICIIFFLVPSITMIPGRSRPL